MPPADKAEFHRQLLAACADVAWWYGWPPQAIDDLDVADFTAFQKEAARQIKAGYRNGM